MYIISKIFWFFAQPINLMFAVLMIGTALLFSKFHILGRNLVVGGLFFGLLIAHAPIGQLLMRPLEDRFGRPADPQHIAGIISLGGGFELDVSASRGVVEIGSASDRINELILLARRFPEAKVIYTGGTSNILYDGVADGEIIRSYFKAFGIEPNRLIIEARSRNTHENAIFTRDLVKPSGDQSFLLITSAFHMPRSMGVFRKAGWNVIPWPVDFRTTGKPEFGRFFYSADLYLENTHLAAKEWIGLIAYWVGGLTGELFPSQETASTHR
jgi:uncharacterized SAM-binding protein YcdF (DUF218 family)